MSVLKGEGKVPILFGSTSIAAGNRTHAGYLARPDLTGEWPTILVIHAEAGISSSVKDICRRLSRQGLAALAIDLYGGKGPQRNADDAEKSAAFGALDLAAVRRTTLEVLRFVANPAGFWSSAEHGFGLLAIGAGGRFAPAVATAAAPEALGLMYSPVSEGFAEELTGYDGAMLGVWGGADEVTDLDVVRDLRTARPRTEVVFYADVGHAFLDDSHDDYDFGAAADALERLSEFYSKRLPPPPA